MSVERGILSPEVQSHAQRLVEAGRFADIDEAVQAGLQALEDDESWKRHAQERVQQGLDDIASGRTISGPQFLEQLAQGRLRRA